MSFLQNNGHLQMVENNLSDIVQNVLERGYDDFVEEFDDFSIIITQYEFNKLVTFQLYEVYFPPKRHEFELQILSNIVDAVAQSWPVAFIGTAALSGIVGSTAYEVSKRLFAHVAKNFQKDKKRSKPFHEIDNNLMLIRNYFETRENAKIEDISEKLNVDRNKIEPLLKLLGFKCKRKKKQQIWIRPMKW